MKYGFSKHSAFPQSAVLNVLDADSEKILKCADKNLQQRRHIGRKKSRPVVLCEVFCVD